MHTLTHPHDEWDVTQQPHDSASRCAGRSFKLLSGQQNAVFICGVLNFKVWHLMYCSK